MDEALFRLGRAGKRVLEVARAAPIALERRPPTQKEHFVAVNDMRIAAELAGSLSYFFAYWELPGLGWRTLAHTGCGFPTVQPHLRFGVRSWLGRNPIFSSDEDRCIPARLGRPAG